MVNNNIKIGVIVVVGLLCGLGIAQGINDNACIICHDKNSKKRRLAKYGISGLSLGFIVGSASRVSHIF
jgi:hypothetical protein